MQPTKIFLCNHYFEATEGFCAISVTVYAFQVEPYQSTGVTR